MKTIMVVGGAGFIGSHLCDSLLRSGNRVICVDNLITGDVCNIGDAYNHRNFRFVQADASHHAIAEILQEEDVNLRNIQQIYYLASIASPDRYLKLPLETFAANVYGLQRFLEIAVRNHIRLLYTSTSEVYGDPKEHPQSESYTGNVDPCIDRAIYDESKRFGETLVTTFRRKFGIEVRIVRIFNTYGPRMARSDGRVVPNFIWQALKNEKMTIYGDGRQTRSFCYVQDTVAGIIAAMENSHIGPINIGNPYEYYSILEVAQLIHRLIGSHSTLWHTPLTSQKDPRVRRPDIALAKRQLSWEPTISFTNGLIPTIKYFKEAYM